MDITQIKHGAVDNLSVSLEDMGEYGSGMPDLKVVFLFTPDMSDTLEHFHIELNKEEALALYKALFTAIQEMNRAEKRSG